MRKLLISLSALIVLLVSGCTKHASQIEPADISHIGYEKLSCKQLKKEFIEVDKRLAVVSIQQDKAADKYTAGALLMSATGIFNPYLVDVDQEALVGKLKGEEEAIKNVAIKKRCKFATTL